MNDVELLFDFLYFFSKKLKLEMSLNIMKQEHSFAVMNLFQLENSKKQFVKVLNLVDYVYLSIFIWRFLPSVLISCHLF